MNELFIIFMLCLLSGVWINILSARETALNFCQRCCEQNRLQFLDQSIALYQMKIIWGTDGISLRRVYRFEYSADGTERGVGYLTLQGSRLENFIV